MIAGATVRTSSLLTLLFSTLCAAQLPNIGSESRPTHYRVRGGVDTRRILRTPGQVLVAGENTKPTGKLKVLTYRIERVTLKSPVMIGAKTTDSSYHLIITGGPFECPCGVSVDDQRFPAQNLGPNQAAVQFFVKPQFEDGSTISVADENGETVLPERMSVPAELRREQPKYKSRLRRVAWVVHLGARQVIVLLITAPEKFPVLNSFPVIQVGKEYFDARADNEYMSALIPEEKFSELPDNAPIYFSYGSKYRFVGHLEKSNVH